LGEREGGRIRGRTTAMNRGKERDFNLLTAFILEKKKGNRGTHQRSKVKRDAIQNTPFPRVGKRKRKEIFLCSIFEGKKKVSHAGGTKFALPGGKKIEREGLVGVTKFLKKKRGGRRNTGCKKEKGKAQSSAL